MDHYVVEILRYNDLEKIKIHVSAKNLNQAIIKAYEFCYNAYECTIWLISPHYIDPYNYDVDLDKLLAEPVASATEVLSKYSWEEEAKKLLELLRE